MNSIRKISYQQSHVMTEILLQQGYDVVIILVMHRAASENVHN